MSQRYHPLVKVSNSILGQVPLTVMSWLRLKRLMKICQAPCLIFLWMKWSKTQLSTYYLLSSKYSQLWPNKNKSLRATTAWSQRKKVQSQLTRCPLQWTKKLMGALRCSSLTERLRRLLPSSSFELLAPPADTKRTGQTGVSHRRSRVRTKPWSRLRWSLNSCRATCSPSKATPPPLIIDSRGPHAPVASPFKTTIYSKVTTFCMLKKRTLWPTKRSRASADSI